MDKPEFNPGSLYKILSYLTSLKLVCSLRYTHTHTHTHCLSLSMCVYAFLQNKVKHSEKTLWKMLLNNFTYLKLILSWKCRVLNNDFMVDNKFFKDSYGHWAICFITHDKSIETTCLNFTWQWEKWISLIIGKLVSQKIIIELFLPAQHCSYNALVFFAV